MISNQNLRHFFCEISFNGDFSSDQFFNQVLMLGKTSISDLSEHVFDLILELYNIDSHLLLSVLPQLEFKLKVTIVKLWLCQQFNHEHCLLFFDSYNRFTEYNMKKNVVIVRSWVCAFSVSGSSAWCDVCQFNKSHLKKWSAEWHHLPHIF